MYLDGPPSAGCFRLRANAKTKRRKWKKWAGVTRIVLHPVGDSFDAFLHELCTEVKEQTQALVGKFQICEKLFVMNLCELLNRLEFKDHKNSGTVPESFSRTVWSQTSMDTGFDARIKGWN